MSKTFLDGFGPMMKLGIAPSPAIAIAVMRVMDDASQKHPRLMERMLADLWQQVSPVVLETVKKDPVDPKDVAAIVLSLYFQERGDWKKMEAKALEAVRAANIPEATITTIAELLAKIMFEATAAAERAGIKVA